MNKRIFVLLPALALLLGACGGNEPTPSTEPSVPASSEEAVVPVESVEISKKEVTLDPDQSIDLSAVVKPANATNRNITWSSDNEAIATVNSNGRVTALKTGTAKVKATSAADNTKFAECTVTVNKRYLPTVVDNPAVDTEYRLGLYQGDQSVRTNVYMTGEIVEAGGAGKNRMETSRAWGDAAIVKLHEAGENQYKVQVGEKAYISIGEGTHYFTKPLAEDIAKAAVFTWNAEEKTLITKVTEGESTKDYYLGTNRNFEQISLTEGKYLGNEGNYTAHLYTAVEAADPTGITLDKTELSIHAGYEAFLTATLTPGNAYGIVKWTSDNAKVTVEDGKVAVAEDAAVGTKAKITATVDTFKAEATVTVTEAINHGSKEQPLTVEQVRSEIDKLAIGEKTQKKVVVKGLVSQNTEFSERFHNFDGWMASTDLTNAKAFQIFRAKYDKELGETYNAENSLYNKYATVEGYVYHYIDEGKHIDSYQFAQGAYVIKVEDNTVTPEVKGVSLDVTEATIKATEKVTLKATLVPFNATGDITWTSDHPEIATVENGVVTGVKGGTAIITAACGEFKATATITVEQAVEIPEPAIVKNSNLSAILANDVKNLSQKFEMTVKVKSYAQSNSKQADAADAAGYLRVTDLESNNEVFVNGSSATDPLVWNKVTGVYDYTKPTDFLTNATTKDIKPGYELDIIAARNDFFHTWDEGFNKQITAKIVAVREAKPVGPKEFPAGVENGIKLTTETLDLTSQQYGSYTTIVGGVTMKAFECGNYGDGIQLRDKSNKNSAFFNVTATTKAIKSITITMNADKNVRELAYIFGDASLEAADIETGTKFTADATTKTITIEAPTDKAYTFFKIGHPGGKGSAYIDNVVVNYVA